MNQRPGTALPSSPVSSFQRWRLQIFAITWLAYAAFYFTRKAFSVAKLGIAEDPGFQLDKMAMADLDAIYLAACRRPVHLGRAGRPLRPAHRGVRRPADLRTGRAGHGHLRHPADLRHLHGGPGTGAVHRLVGAVQEHRQFLRHPRTRSGARPVEHLLRLRRPGRLAVRRLVGVQRVRYLARGVLLQRRGGRRRGPAVPVVAAQPPGGRRPSTRRTAGRERGRALCRLQAERRQRRQPAGARQGGAQPHGALPRPGLLPAQAGATRSSCGDR